ncbi:leucine-rich repeat domain-containing protein [Flavobacterium sp.]|uniref:DUF7619 domain-containing protein n=1 Tax=Flavobacterium sp. TaxID=239 RepID=UPI000E9BE7B6|nr:leucine-rich repeat domain-containing protein [Flavobacterium sp.]HBD25805.1 T9SS C-terminal target domain-containing protein [Flavobacterium sp.]
MKTKLLFFLSILSFNFVNSQIVNIPDTNFRSRLLAANTNNEIAKNLSGNYFKIDSNNDSQIQLSEALQVSYLNAGGLSSEPAVLTGITSFSNLTELYCHSSNLPTLDLTSMTNLQKLNCGYCQMTSLNVAGLTSLTELNCFNNQLTSLNISGLVSLQKLDYSLNQITSLNVSQLPTLTELKCRGNAITNLNVSQNVNLVTLYCGFNQLTTLNVSTLTNLNYLECGENLMTTLDLSATTHLQTLECFNSPIVSFFLKNGSNLASLIIFNSPNLRYICADESELPFIQDELDNLNYTNCVINSYCSFVPGGAFYTVNGNIKFDLNNDGCNNFDVAFPNLKFSITNGTVTSQLFVNQNGDYSIPLQTGNYTITPVTENPLYFNCSPASLNINFPTTTSPYTQNFCVSPNGNYPDLEVVLLPITSARPGFDAHYEIVFKNKGNITQSGSVTLTYNDAVLDYVSSSPNFNSQATNTFTWNFTNLQPYETRNIPLTLNLNSPLESPPLNMDDYIDFSVAITNIATDATPLDNVNTLHQLVVNSFDPNDKTCTEGSIVPPSTIGKYVHYIIRFENNGTANAENIVVKDIIDTSKFDISTLIPLSGSYPFVTRITNTNSVEFIFQNINLPFDNANNDGYVAFKIKIKPTLTIGSTFSNSAYIYFDYNAPIVTNNYETIIQALGVNNNETGSKILIYPNPVNDMLFFNTEENVIKVDVYDTTGRILSSNSVNDNKLNINDLQTGNYILKVYTENGITNAKIIKE